MNIFFTIDNGESLLTKTSDGIIGLISCLSDHVPSDETITIIGSEAFAFNKKLKNVVIPKNVSEIFSDIFVGCNIDTMTVDSNNEDYFSPEGSNVIMQSVGSTGTMFGIRFGCAKSVIPADATTYPEIILGAASFAGINDLETITIPKNVVSISPDVFALTNIKTVTYAGTKEEWLERFDSWHKYVPVDTVVTCSGGEPIEYKAWE